ERRQVERILTLAAADRVTYETGLAEHAEVSAGRRPAHVEGVRDLSRISRGLVQHDEDLSPYRIGERLGDGVHGLQYVTIWLLIASGNIGLSQHPSSAAFRWRRAPRAPSAAS